MRGRGDVLCRGGKGRDVFGRGNEREREGGTFCVGEGGGGREEMCSGGAVREREGGGRSVWGREEGGGKRCVREGQ